MFVDRADDAPSNRLAHRSARRQPPRPRWFLFAVLAILAALGLGPAASYARRAATRGSAHHKHGTTANAGLVSAWGFGGGSGGTGATIADASRHGNAITLVNATLTAAGRYGGGVRFTGQDSFATAPASPSLSLTSGMTLEAWVRPSKLAPGSATIIAKTRAGGRFPYGLDLTGGRPVAYGTIGARYIKARTRLRLPRNRWSFVAATYDGSTLRVYIGARLAAKMAAKGKFRKSAGPLQIGGNQVRGEYFTGSIDNVRIFAKARSPKQLASDRRTPVRGGIIHGPLSTTGGTGPGGTGSPGSPSGGPLGVGPIGQGSSVGIGLPPPPGPAVYVSQSAAGSDDGSSCANAHSAAWFNASSDWGTNAGQIGPGDVVHLCGTISSDLTVQRDGTAGSPITIYFEPGAELSQPACPGACLSMSNRSYITIDGGGTGVIENTANGTGLADDVGDTAIVADPCNGCTIEYLTIQNIYVRTSESDTGAGASNTGCMSVSGSNLTVAYDTMDWAHWCVLVDENGHPTDSNLRFYGNNISDTDHGIALAFYKNTGGTNLGPFYFYANDIHDYAAWDTGASDTYHHDGFHCYSSDGTPYIGGGLYLYDNVWGGNVGSNDTAQMFIEGTPSGTPCSTSNSPIYVFNNVVEASQSGSPTNDYFTLSSGVEDIYNNTILGHNDYCLIFNNAGGGTATLENNLVSGCDQEISNSGANNGPMTLSYNLYAAGGPNSFACDNNTYAFSQFSRWQSCIGGDSHSSTTANAHLNGDGSLQSGSPAAGAGANLTSVCSGQPNPGLGALCESIFSVPRPTSGAWNAGAF
jgi:hypothetical protein